VAEHTLPPPQEAAARSKKKSKENREKKRKIRYVPFNNNHMNMRMSSDGSENQ